MKLYPVSKSTAARPVEWTVILPHEQDVGGHTFLSATKPRRALARLITHLWREFPTALRIETSFPCEDIYLGEDAAA